MADGCLSNIVKYLLFITNFIIFLLGLAVLGCGIWVLVDKPSFLDLFEQAESLYPDLEGKFDINLYTSAAYIIIVIAALVAIIAFFGCFGAIRESKCMLGTYFVLMLALFIVMVVGAVLGYTGDLESSLKDPLFKSMEGYDNTVTQNGDSVKWAYREVWNEVQSELRCCGVEGVSDWEDGKHGDHHFNATHTKPEGCCHFQKGTSGSWDNIWENNTLVNNCLKSTDTSTNTYKFEGCYNIIVNEITDNQDILVGVAIGVVVVMFLNMLFSFAMCTMAS